MSCKRKMRRKVCEGKARHETSKLAMIEKHKLGQSCMNVYKCQFCKKFHIGHSAYLLKRNPASKWEARRQC